MKYFTGPSELWTNDSVLIIETVDGVNVPRTEEWLVKMLICDWYWIYGGRAPTAAEFRAATANKHISDGTLIEQLSALVDTFSINPTPTNRIEPRGLALTKICPLFPEYPLVDKLLRDWTAREHRPVGVVNGQCWALRMLAGGLNVCGAFAV